ncbi:hypothetical protein [Nocardioides stalactiti]|uniref:hypothetical protein n=1 Tax=Nocardioides stalactiti TaxID=2755356 RepID=UPI0016010CBC|nr:hypothetical protein [Nocardioides stalactiti]
MSRGVQQISHKGDDSAVDAVPENGRKLARRRALATLLVAIVVGTTGYLAWAAEDKSDQVRRRNEAVDVAERAAVAILRYDHARLAQDVEAATAFMTPGFAEEYREYAKSTVNPLATKYRAVLTTEMVASGIERIDGDEATVLLYVNQTTRSSRLVAPRVDSSAVEMRLSWTDGVWLVAGIEPI